MRAKKLVTVGGIVFLVLLGLSRFGVVQRSFSQSSSSYAKGGPAGFVGPVVPAKVTAAAQGRILAAYGKLPLSFEVNQGQADGRVKFLAHGSGYTLRLTPGEAVLSLRKEGSPQHTVSPRRNIGASGTQVSPHTQSSTVGSVEFATLRIGLAGANPRPRVVGVDELPGKTNYFVGNNSANWHTQIPSYARVKYESIYPGIDLIYHGKQGQLEYDFAIAPGADPRAIRLSIEPRRNLRLDAASAAAWFWIEGSSHFLDKCRLDFVPGRSQGIAWATGVYLSFGEHQGQADGRARYVAAAVATAFSFNLLRFGR